MTRDVARAHIDEVIDKEEILPWPVSASAKTLPLGLRNRHWFARLWPRIATKTETRIAQCCRPVHEGYFMQPQAMAHDRDRFAHHYWSLATLERLSMTRQYQLRATSVSSLPRRPKN